MNTKEVLRTLTINDEHKAKLKKVIDEIAKNKGCVDFLHPVDHVSLGLTDYLDFVKKPMDIFTLRDNLKKNVYQNVLEPIEDLQLIWENCMIYNREDSAIYSNANKLDALMIKIIEKAYDIKLNPASTKIPSIPVQVIQNATPTLPNVPKSKEKKQDHNTHTHTHTTTAVVLPSPSEKPTSVKKKKSVVGDSTKETNEKKDFSEKKASYEKKELNEKKVEKSVEKDKSKKKERKESSLPPKTIDPENFVAISDVIEETTSSDLTSKNNKKSIKSKGKSSNKKRPKSEEEEDDLDLEVTPVKSPLIKTSIHAKSKGKKQQIVQNLSQEQVVVKEEKNQKPITVDTLPVPDVSPGKKEPPKSESIRKPLITAKKKLAVPKANIKTPDKLNDDNFDYQLENDTLPVEAITYDDRIKFKESFLLLNREGKTQVLKFIRDKQSGVIDFSDKEQIIINVDYIVNDVFTDANKLAKKLIEKENLEQYSNGNKKKKTS